VVDVPLTEDFFENCLWSPVFMYAFTRDVDVADAVRAPRIFKVQTEDTFKIAIVTLVLGVGEQLEQNLCDDGFLPTGYPLVRHGLQPFPI